MSFDVAHMEQESSIGEVAQAFASKPERSKPSKALFKKS